MAITQDGLYVREYRAAARLRVKLENLAGTKQTGKLFTDITEIKVYAEDGTVYTPVITEPDWIEVGNGQYDILFDAYSADPLTPAELTNELGETTLHLEVSGCKERDMQVLVVEQTVSDRIAELPGDGDISNILLAISTVLTAVQSVGNSTYEALSVAFSYDRPKTGTKTYDIPLAIRDRDTSGMVDADAPPVIRIYENGGDVLVDTTMPKESVPRTGMYLYSWTIDHEDELRSNLLVDVSYAVAGVPSVVVRQTMIIDPLSEDTVQAGCAAAISDAALATALELGLTRDAAEAAARVAYANRIIRDNQELLFEGGSEAPFLTFNLFAEDGTTPTMVYPFYRIREELPT